jgi:hypothetical protein
MRLVIPAVLIALLTPSARAESRSVLVLVTQPKDQTLVTIHSDDKQDWRNGVTVDEACKAIAGIKGWGSVVTIFVATDRAMPRKERKALFDAIDANGVLGLMYYGTETPKHLSDYFLKQPAREKSADVESEPLIPAPLNVVLPKIKAGMTPDEVKDVLAAAYPKLVRQDGPWSGQTGYIGFRLDERYTVLLSAHSDATGKTVMSDGPKVSVVDQTRKVRAEITIYAWGVEEKKDSPKRVMPDDEDTPEAIDRASKRGATTAAADIRAGGR